MADTVEELLVKISADVTDLKAGMEAGAGHVKVAGEHVNRAGKEMEMSLEGVKHAVEGLRASFQGLVAGEIAELIKRSLDYSESLQTMSKTLGISTDKLQEWHYVAVSAGMSTDAIDTGLRRLSISLGKAAEGGDAANAVFKRLHLDPQNFKDSDNAMTQVLTSLSKITDAGQRSALAMEIFGRQAGPKMAELAAEGVDELEKLRQAAHDVGAVMGEDMVNRAAAASKEVNQLGLVIKTQLNSALSELAPVLTAVIGILATSVHGWALLTAGVRDYFATVKDGMGDHEKLIALFTEQTRLQAMASLDKKTGAILGAYDKDIADLEKINKQIAGILDKKSALRTGGEGATVSTGREEELDKYTKERMAIIDKMHVDELNADTAAAEKHADIESKLNVKMHELKSQQFKDSADFLDKQKSLLASTEQDELALLKAAEAEKIKAINAAAKQAADAVAKTPGLNPKQIADEQAKIERNAQQERTNLTRKGEEERLKIVQDFNERRVKDELKNIEAGHKHLEQSLHEAAKIHKSFADDDFKRRGQELERTRDAKLMEATINQKGEEEILAIWQDYRNAKDQLDDETNQATLDMASQTFSGLSALMNVHNRKLFEIGKIAAISNAVLAMYTNISNTIKSGPGFPWNVALIAGAVAQGVSNIAAIKSTQYGSGATSSPGGGVGAATAPASGRPSGPNTYISLPAGQNFYSGDMIRELITQINQAQGDGSRITVVS